MGSKKVHPEERSWLSDGKNLIILVLVVVALVQAGFLFVKGEHRLGLFDPKPEKEITKQVEPEPEQEAEDVVAAKPTVSVSGVSLEPELRRYLLVSFDRPVGKDFMGKPVAKDPASISPKVYGTWSWISPFMLRFDAQTPFLAGGNYHVAIKPETFMDPAYDFTGNKGYDLHTGRFAVKDFKVFQKTSSKGKAMVKLSGEVKFTYSVKPEVFMKNFKIIDPLHKKPVPFVVTTSYRSRYMSFRTDPIQKQEQPRDVRFHIAQAMKSASGDLGLANPYEQKYSLELDPNLYVKKIVVRASGEQQRIKASFSTPVLPETARKFLKITPPVKYTFTADGNELFLQGAFKPGTTYAVRFEKGLLAADGAVLGKAFEQKLTVPNLDPLVTFKDKGMFLSRDGFRTLAMKSVNTERANIYVDRVYPNNLFMLLGSYSGQDLMYDSNYKGEIRHVLGDRIVEKKLKIPGTLNKWQETRLELDKYIPKGELGFYRVMANLPGEWEAAQRWVLLTDLGMVAKKGEDEILVWISSFKNLAPQGGVEVQLISDQNQVIAQGSTDDKGLWKAENLAELFKKNRPAVVVAKKGDDFSFLLLDDFKIDTTGQKVGGVEISKKGYVAYLYGERDIYRPGETAKGIALVRDARLHVPPAMPLRMRVKDPQGRKLSDKVVKSDDKGQAEFTLPLPSYAITGSYTLELLAAENVIGTYRFKVEEFMPDRIKVEIDTPKAEVETGDALNYDVLSRYFFGPPAAGMSVESRVRLQNAQFAPAGFDAYSFGDPERTFEGREIYASKKGMVLDDEGNMNFTVDLPKGLKPPAALEAMITARVRERGGRGVAARQRVLVHAYASYPGLKKLTSSGFEPGKEVNMEYVVLTPQGKDAPGATLRVDLFHDRWQTVLRRTPSGGYKYDSIRDSELVFTQELTEGDARGGFNVVPPEWGAYRVVLTDANTGASSQMKFYASGWGYSPWAIENPALVEIVPDKEEYLPGETAKFQIRAPFSGKMLVTVEGDSVFDTQVHELKENTAEIEFDVKEEYSPNVYVNAVLVRAAEDLEPGGVARASGTAPFYVNRTANKPEVKIFSPAEIRPETKLEIGIQSEPGATVTIAAVDEGILQLIAQDTPDPFSTFYAKRVLTVDSYDIFSMLFPEINPVMDKSAAGGGAGLDKMRQFVRTEGIRRVKPVAFWSGPLETDSEGKVVFPVDVPDFNGALRIMAVVSKGKKFSSSHAITRVKGPLIITPTLPRFLSTDEKVLVPVTLRNETKQDGQFKLSMDVTGPAKVLDQNKSMILVNGTEDVTYFTVATGRDQGKVTCVVRAEGNGESAKTEIDLGVRSSLPVQSIMQSGGVDTQVFTIPTEGTDTYRPESVTREIRIGQLPMVRFSGSLEYLLNYPYGCLEQTTSRGFPLLYFRELAEELEPKLFEHQSAPAMVQAAIARVQSMQLHNGGFSMWPGGDRAHAWGSTYATHFLVEAKRAGYHVSKSMLDQALSYLSSLVKGKDKYSVYELNSMSYSLYVLALAGRPDRGSMDYLRVQQKAFLTQESAALIGAGYAALGDARAMKELIRGTYKAYTGRRQTGGNFSSPLRNLALRLAVIVQAAPEDKSVGPMVQQLVTLMDSVPHRTTQENSFAFMALGKYFSHQKSKAPYEGKLFAGNEFVADFSSDKVFYYSDIKGQTPLRLEMNDGYEAGAAYFSVQTCGIPTREAYTPKSQGIEVERAYLTRDGVPIAAGQLKQGDLVVVETRVRSKGGPILNVVVQNLLPTGLEVENPRLESTERLFWIERAKYLPYYQDIRDDRVLLFVYLPGKDRKTKKNPWETYYSLLRVVTPGEFTVPPVQVEAMYNPALMASGTLDTLVVAVDSGTTDAFSNSTDEPAATDGLPLTNDSP